MELSRLSLGPRNPRESLSRRLTAPLRELRRFGDRVRRILWPRKYQFKPYAFAQLAPLDGAQSLWQVQGPNPQVLLVSRSGRYPTRWCELRIRMKYLPAGQRPVLHADQGGGFSEGRALVLAPPVNGRLKAVIELPRRTCALRLDPCHEVGCFEINDIEIREIARSRAKRLNARKNSTTSKSSWQEAIDLITASRLFDPVWYLAQNPDVAKAHLDPLDHYVRRGASEGRDPNPAFDTAWYLTQHPDAANSSTNPLIHYIRHTNSQPHPAFEEQLYRDANPNLVGALRDGLFSTGFQHFVNHGRQEIADRNPWRRLVFRIQDRFFDFEEAAYIHDNADVRTLVEQKAFASGLEHFLAIGYVEICEGIRVPYSPDRFVRLLSTRPGAALAPRGRHACIFAHYDRDGLIDDYVVEYLKALHSQSVDIYFVSSTDQQVELSKISTYVSTIFIKNDTGRDFGSWYIALKELGLEFFIAYDYLILANDSIYFPITSLDRLFPDMSLKRFNLWGITDSKEFGTYHIQSYFLAFDSKARATVLAHFVEEFELHPHLTKWGQISQYELRLTQFASDRGLSVGAYCSIADIREDAIREAELSPWRALLQPGLDNLNPTHALWDLLISRYNCPALKIELLRDNPLTVPHVDKWPRILSPEGLKPSLIQAHLDRMRDQPLQVSSLGGQVPRPATSTLKLLGQIEGEGFTGARRLVLFAHYDPDGIVDDYVVEQIAALRRCDSSIVFITSASEKAIHTVRPLCASILLKSNVGRDFGSWYLGVKVFAEQLGHYQNVIWMNDSTYFPLQDPADMFRTMGPRSFDFWGIIDSYLERWHIMSWFWSFGKRIIDDRWFDHYCDTYNDRYSKWDQIRNYEMRFPSEFRFKGYRVGTYISVDSCREYALSLPARERSKYNLRKDASATHDYWDILISRFRCPALKIELLLHNPLHRDLSRLFHLIEADSTYDTGLIRNHLGRLERRVARSAPEASWSRAALLGIMSRDGAAFVNAAYRRLTGRAPEADTFAACLGRLRAGESKLSIVRELLLSSDSPRSQLTEARLEELLGETASHSTVIHSNTSFSEDTHTLASPLLPKAYEGEDGTA